MSALSSRSRSSKTQPLRVSVSRRSHTRQHVLPEEKNAAPSQWARRLARSVGAHFGVEMVGNQARNEGRFGNRRIVIKCAKSPSPPVSVLVTMLERLDEMWAVFILPSGEAEVWRVKIEDLQNYGYCTRGASVQQRVEITRKKVVRRGQLLGTIEAAKVEACRIP